MLFKQAGPLLEQRYLVAGMEEKQGLESCPQGRLLGQRPHRESVGPLEGRQAVRQAVCHPARGDGRSDGLAQFLQPQKIALDAGLCQPDDVRATLDRGPAARQEVRIIGRLWSADNRGKVSEARSGGD